MRSRLAAGLVALTLPLLGVAGPAYADHDQGRCYYDDCGDSGNYGGDQGNGNDQRRCAHSGDNCRNWSPTFDKSPVDISGNQFCVMPGSCAAGNDGKRPPEKQPASMITNPAKLIEFPITISQMCFEFVTKILQLMV